MTRVLSIGDFASSIGTRKDETTISDDEIVYQEEKSTFYYLKYGPFTIGTARPETKFGDKYVVMHPNDSRYADWKDGTENYTGMD